MAGYAAEAGAAAGAGRGRAARHPPLTSLVVSTIAAFSAVVVFAILRSAYDAAVSRTTTLLGHNLEPTPWHLFKHDKGRPPARAAFRPETNIEPWSKEFRDIKEGAKAIKWQDRVATAYWKGNPDVASPLRVALLNCNDTNMWHAEIMRQNWDEEVKSGYHNSKLSSQCTHRYKIYAEGFAWSVSLKYILSCGSMALVIDPQYEDFFSRGLRPEVNFWPVHIDVAAGGMCESIRDAVEWGEAHPAEAEAVGRRGQRLMEELDMDAVYDYMLHLLTEYARLMRFRPAEAPPPRPPAQEVCEASVLCLAGEKQRRFLEASAASPAVSEPCVMPPDAGE
uniref:Glycosyl transferase CAP10 domain-containing protein n=1 Tax=Oryza glumipatula TaxID=40148 RepID=A0A0D9ZU96_9ORYZ